MKKNMKIHENPSHSKVLRGYKIVEETTRFHPGKFKSYLRFKNKNKKMNMKPSKDENGKWK